MNTSNKPLLVTMGDAAGIGPEIIVKAFEQGALTGCVVIGDPAVLRRAGSVMTAVLGSPADLPEVPPGCLRAGGPATRRHRRPQRRSRCALHRSGGASRAGR